MAQFDLVHNDGTPFSTDADVTQEAESSGRNDNVVTRSLRGGVYGAGSQLASLGGAVTDAAGFEGATQSLRSAAGGLRAQAQLPQNAPKVGSFRQLRDNPSLDNAGEYLGGLVGGSLPIMGAGLAGGLATGGAGAVPAMLGAAAATAPFEMGDIAQKQLDDPQAMAQPAGTRLRDAMLGGAASAALQGVVPGMVGRQILGKVAAPAVRETVGGVLKRNALDIPLEGVTEAGGEAVKQFAANQDAPLDQEALLEAGIGGAAAGGAFAGVGAGADLARMPGGKVGDAVGGTFTSIKDRLAAAKDTTAAAVTEAPKRMAPLSEDLGELFQRGRGAAADIVEKVRNGEVLGDLKAFANAAPERAREMMGVSDNETVQHVKQWGEEMLNDAGLTPERRAQVAEAMGTAGERAGQMAMAGLKKTWDAGRDLKTKIGALQGSFESQGDVGPKKLSANYAGANKAIADKLRPLLVLRRQELLEDPEDLAGVADVSRRAVEAMGTGVLSSDTIFRLIETLGSDTAATLDAAYRTVGDLGDQAKTEKFYTQLNEIAETQKRSDGLKEFIASSLTPESAKMIGPSQMGEFARLLVSHARGERSDPNAGPAQREAADRHFREQLAQHFGDKVDAVSIAIEKEAGLGKGGQTDGEVDLDENGAEVEAAEGGFDESGNRVSAESLDVVRKGQGKNNAPVMDPKLFAANREQGQNYAAQYIKDMQAKYPDHDVRFELAEGSTTHGHVIASKSQDKDALSDADVDGMKLDTKRYATSKDRIEVGGHILDTRRIAKALDKRMPYSAENQTRAQRLAEMFNAGVARLMDRFGSFEVPDTAVIGTVAGRDLTFGAAKKLDTRTKADEGADSMTSEMQDLRLQWARATWPAERLAKIKQTPEPMEGADLAKLRTRIKGLAQEIAKEVDAELASGDDIQERGGMSTGPLRQPLPGNVAGPRTESSKAVGTTRANNGEEKGHETQDADKAGNIHEVAKRVKESDMINRSNMDGSANSAVGKDRGVSTNLNTAVMAVAALRRADGAPAKKIAGRLGALLAHANAMSAKDLRVLSEIVPGMIPSKVAEIINPLARKYAGAITAPGVGAESIPAKAGTKQEPATTAFADGKAINTRTVAAQRTARSTTIASRQEYLNNPPADYTSESATEIVEWAKAQIGPLALEIKAETDPGAKEELRDMRRALEALIGKAESVLEGDASLAEFEGGPPSPKAVAAKKAALLARAASGDKALIAELRSSDDAKGLQRAAGVLPPGAALDAANARLAELVQDPDVAYGLQTERYSNQAATGPASTANTRADVAAHIDKVLGKSVRLEWANLTHAGEFERMKLRDVIRLSVHALDPMSTAFHESLHGFFAQLRDAGAADVIAALQKAAQSDHVVAQLEARFAGEPSVLAQLADPEERAAYMYQVWATDPTFKVSIAARTRLEKIAEFIRKVLGIWSNDERALHIMGFFHSGQYVNQSKAAGHISMMSPGSNGAVDAAKAMAKQMTSFADAVVSTGSGRLRATEIPALAELADLIKREGTDASGGDRGFIAAARVARTQRLNALGEVLEGYTPDQLEEAMTALQTDTRAPGPEARLAVRAIKGVLGETRDYMIAAGVDVGDLGADYFPRIWDTHYISKNLTAFRDMLEPYKRNGLFDGDIDELIQRLTSRDGAEIGIETRTPGMQFKKERLLAFIEPADAAPFVNKNLLGTMSSYVTQATRRAEWNRRLGDGKLETLFKEALAQGATPEDLKLADSYLRGVDGTLGDGINPTLRRLMGNMIVYQNVRLLPMAVFSSIVDPVGVMVRGGTVGDAWATFKRGVAELPQSYGREASSDEATRMAELVGVIDSAVLSSVMGDLYTQGMVGGTAQKINTAFFKYNMMEGLNRSFRVGASEAAMKFIARHADGTHSVHSTRWMNELGLRPGDVVTTQRGHMALSEADGLTQEQTQRVRAAINQWVDGAVLRPDAADKPLWMNDPHWALVSHLKQFVYTFQKVILGRVTHELEHGNYTPMMALAAYVPVMMGADFTKGLIQGGGDQPEWKKGWDLGDYVGHGVQRAGLLGVGQFGYDVVEERARGGSGIGALSGPTIEQFTRVLEVMGGDREFGPMLLKSLPANALYGGLADGADPAPVIER